MIPNNTKQATVEGNVKPLRHRAMTVNADAIPYIMDMLTKLYSDNELACIREYSTNAWDSHVEAGNTGRPIEVNTPSQLSPFLSIRDYGTGLSSDDLLDMFSEYGLSTKREDEKATGSMGVGSKSALAYTSQFTMVSIKDGIRAEVSISVDERGVGDVAIISEGPTTEHNGVEVLIPANRDHSFGVKAANFFQFWAEGTVLLNGQEPARTFRKLSDRIYFYEGDSDVIVMGNIAYPIRWDKAITRNINRHVACYVTMNGPDEVCFVPAREALVYNPITENSIEGLREEFNDAVKNFIKESIESTSTRVDALAMWKEMKDIFGYACGNSFEWNGEPVSVEDVLTYEVPLPDGTKRTMHRQAIEFDVNKTRNAVSTASRLSVNYFMNKGLVITGFPNDSLSSAYKARIRLYVSQNGIKTGGYGRPGLILVREDNYASDLWHTAALEGKTVAWADVLAATKPEKRERVAAVERDGAYDVLVEGESFYQEMDLDIDDNIVYYTVADYGNQGLYGDYARYVFDEEPDAKIVCVRANRVAKLKRIYNNVREFDMTYWLGLKGKRAFDALTPEQIETLKTRYTYRHMGDYQYSYSDFGVTKRAFKNVDNIADTEYAGVLRAYFAPGVPNENVLEYSTEFVTLRTTWKDKAIRFDKRYPLAQWDKHPTETLEYVNAAYAKNGESNE
jgi:hypothetical protein